MPYQTGPKRSQSSEQLFLAEDEIIQSYRRAAYCLSDRRDAAAAQHALMRSSWSGTGDGRRQVETGGHGASSTGKTTNRCVRLCVTACMRVIFLNQFRFKSVSSLSSVRLQNHVKHMSTSDSGDKREEGTEKTAALPNVVNI